MNIYKQIYKILHNKQTPLTTDCGLICDTACCKGDANTGMILFPGEEKLFAGYKGKWFSMTDSNIVLSNNQQLQLLTCNGDCPRDKRPLACRIFPFMPYITEQDELEIMLDLKSVKTCPLCFNAEKYTIDPKFIDALYDAFVILISDQLILEYIYMLSDDYDDAARLLL